MAKLVPACMTALGHRSLPDEILVGGTWYARRRIFKNDFFAATASYEGPQRRVLLKVGRRASFWGVPLAWVGRFLAWREQTAMQLLAEVEGIPRFIERWETTGIVREFVEGRALAKGERVADDFHDRLTAIIDAIHSRKMAYVDLEKCENVLVGDDGKPYLFDFQISWYLPRRWGGELWFARQLRRWFQQGDRYHLTKLKRRTRPDLLTPEEIKASYQKPWYVGLFGLLTRPLKTVRRAILNQIDPRRESGERGRIA